MLEYIDQKGFMGADTASKAVQMHTVQNRKRVEFPNAHEMPSSALAVDSFGPLRLDNFLTTYRAKQMKQRNTKTGLNTMLLQLKLKLRFQFVLRTRSSAIRRAQ